jgi:AraC-like DNA-binding protein
MRVQRDAGKVAQGKTLWNAGATLEQAWRQSGFASAKSFRNAFRNDPDALPSEWRGHGNRRAALVERVSVAEGLILAGNMSITEVSEAIGYSSRTLLTRAFQKVHGMSPSEWRSSQNRNSNVGAPNGLTPSKKRQQK